MCLPFLDLVVSFHKEGISVIEPLYVSFDAPIIELPCGLDKVVVHGGQSQKNGFEPWQEWLDRLGGQIWLSIDFEDVGRRTWAVIVAETSDSVFVEKLNPLDWVVQPHANIDFESQVSSVLFISFGALLDGFFVFGKAVLEPFDSFQEMLLLLVVSVFPSSDHDHQ